MGKRPLHPCNRGSPTRGVKNLRRNWDGPPGVSFEGRPQFAIIPVMTLSISISPEAEAALKAKASAAGVDVETYAARQLELMASPPRSVRAISGPIAEAFARSGMTEDELVELLEAEKHAMRAERRAKQSG